MKLTWIAERLESARARLANAIATESETEQAWWAGYQRAMCEAWDEESSPSAPHDTMDKHQQARQAIDTVTLAMSQVAALEMMDDTLTAQAHNLLTDARRALIAKYQPNVYPHGMD